jgi:sugar/nucleoside kinase (ribokinase family)
LQSASIRILAAYQVNFVQVASAARVPVVLDCGGADGPMSEALLQKVSVISPNESELARLTGRPTDSAAEISSAAGLLKQQQVRAAGFALDCSHSPNKIRTGSAPAGSVRPLHKQLVLCGCVVALAKR